MHSLNSITFFIWFYKLIWRTFIDLQVPPKPHHCFSIIHFLFTYPVPFITVCNKIAQFRSQPLWAVVSPVPLWASFPQQCHWLQNTISFLTISCSYSFWNTRVVPANLRNLLLKAFLLKTFQWLVNFRTFLICTYVRKDYYGNFLDQFFKEYWWKNDLIFLMSSYFL